MVDASPVGEISGSKFQPAEDITIVDPPVQRVSLKHGTRLKLQSAANGVRIVTFEIADNTPSKEEAYAPERR